VLVFVNENWVNGRLHTFDPQITQINADFLSNHVANLRESAKSADFLILVGKNGRFQLQ